MSCQVAVFIHNLADSRFVCYADLLGSHLQKLFRKGQTLSRNAWQVIGRSIRLSPPNFYQSDNEPLVNQTLAEATWGEELRNLFHLEKDRSVLFLNTHQLQHIFAPNSSYLAASAVGEEIRTQNLY